MRSGMSAATSGTEELVLVCETSRSGREDHDKMTLELRRAILSACQLTPGEIVLVPPGTVPKTSSGKIQRLLVRQRLEAGTLRPERPSLRTIMRMKIGAGWLRAQQLARSLLRRPGDR